MNKWFMQAGRLYFCVIIPAVLACVARAHVEQGRFVGQVPNTQGALIVFGDLKPTNVETDIMQTAVTNNSGDYVITNRQLTDLSLNSRGFDQLAEVTPGASLEVATGNTLAIRTEIVGGNNKFDARNYFALTRQILTRNQFGGVWVLL